MGQATCAGAPGGDTVEVVEQQSSIPPCLSYDTEAKQVTYLSDVEGQWDYCHSFIMNSKGLHFVINPDDKELERRTSKELELALDDDWHFVCGGDACDKGPGTLRFLEAMVALKKKYPARVHLLLGNRDVNRLGWQNELEGDTIGHPADAKFTFWKTTKIEETGSQEFEDRRAELSLLRGLNAGEVSDEQVAKSFRDSWLHNGILRQYLERAQLAILLGDALFINGQLKSNALSSTCAATEDVLQTWLVKLNSWCQSKLREMDEHADWDHISKFQGQSQ